MPFLALLGPLFSGWFKTIGNVLANIPPLVWYILGGILALLLAWHVHTGWARVADKASFNAGYNADFKRADARERVFRASIAELEKDLADKNAESEARAKAYSDAAASVAVDQKRLDALARADAGRRGTLEGIRDGAAAKPACKVPDALTEALGGL